MVTGLVPPRIGTRRHARRRSLGPLLADVAGQLDVDLHPWQAHVSDVSLEVVKRNGPGSRLRLAAGTVGIVAGRQCGKSTWCAARVCFQCLLPELPEVAKVVGARSIRPQKVAYCAQDRIGALGRWYEHLELIMSSELRSQVERVVRKNGEEHIRFCNGSEYRVLTPSRTGARGWAFDMVIIDEALAHPADLLGVIAPTMAQRDGAGGCIGSQLVIVSNAGDERSSLLNEQRELGRRAAIEGDTGRCWFEWSVADGADPLDEKVWKTTIPTLDAIDGISTAFVRSQAESMRLEDFAREYLCRHTVRPMAHVIDPVVWAALPYGELDPGMDAVLAVDAAKDRDLATIVAAARLDPYDDASTIAVEIVDQLSTADVAGRIAELVERHEVPQVVIDQYGPLGYLVGQLERSGVYVRAVRVGDVVEAAAGFCDLVSAGRIAHLRDLRFDDAVAVAGRRKIGDRWAFARQGDVDVSPVVAASLATWAVESGAFPTPAIH